LYYNFLINPKIKVDPDKTNPKEQINATWRVWEAASECFTASKGCAGDILKAAKTRLARSAFGCARACGARNGFFLLLTQHLPLQRAVARLGPYWANLWPRLRR